ncbi:MAG: MGMT family protein [Candidatus Doudnabacteria bacterium]
MHKINWSKYTPFQQKVYKAILKIPKGQVWTYGQLASKIGNPSAARAVGNALAGNQDAPYIPCHRVIGSDGAMHGYSAPGGVKRKIMMLKKEGYKHD